MGRTMETETRPRETRRVWNKERRTVGRITGEGDGEKEEGTAALVGFKERQAERGKAYVTRAG